jgi:uncharacterized membrane protein|tara:strand:- start:773 stop:964 length:192 start_codon:yes stop_codon:yes gene_type:complete
MKGYKKTLIKTLIWRVIATSITILSGWLVSGNWKFGLAVGGIDTILKTLGYFSFERIWDKKFK